MTLSVCILVVTVFLVGYCLGRRRGRRQGLEEGKAVARLLIREESLVQGRCALCQRPANGRYFIKSPYLQRIGARKGKATVPFCVSRKFDVRQQNMVEGE